MSSSTISQRNRRNNNDIVIDFSNFDDTKSKKDKAALKISDRFQCKLEDVFICLDKDKPATFEFVTFNSNFQIAVQPDSSLCIL